MPRKGIFVCVWRGAATSPSTLFAILAYWQTDRPKLIVISSCCWTILKNRGRVSWSCISHMQQHGSCIRYSRLGRKVSQFVLLGVGTAPFSSALLFFPYWYPCLLGPHLADTHLAGFCFIFIGRNVGLSFLKYVHIVIFLESSLNMQNRWSFLGMDSFIFSADWS